MITEKLTWVKQKLTLHPELRDSNERLYYHYLLEIGYDTTKTIKDVLKDMEQRKIPYIDSFGRASRKIQEEYPELTILAIPDMRSDEDWSKNLDSRIREVYPMGAVILYGGRDSFIKCYHGSFETKELANRVCLSGTEIRKHVSEDIKSSKDWRAGVIYGTYNRYPTSYQTVDIAVFNGDGTEVLLARKPNEDKYRFVGGFVSPTDASLEHAAKREFYEEAGGAEIEITNYVGSFRVDDWRYRVERDKIMTTLFKAKYIYGKLKASDDISELKWFKTNEIDLIQIVEEHRTMMMVLLQKEVDTDNGFNEKYREKIREAYEKKVANDHDFVQFLDSNPVNNNSVINLQDYRTPGSRVFTGRDRGIEVRNASKIDLIEKESDEITIQIPDDISSINPSFLEEFFFNVVVKLQPKGFFKKFRFQNNGRYKITNDLQEAVERILNSK